MIYQKSNWKKTRYEQILEISGLMGVPFRQALAMRHKAIDSRIEVLERVIEEEERFLEGCYDELEFRFGVEKIARCLKQISRLNRVRPKKSAGGITDADIEAARSYPVDKLVDFKHGKTRAWCHDDKNPSMFHGTRTNTAVCPVCNLKFGSIDILIHRDGYQFADAVRYLGGM